MGYRTRTGAFISWVDLNVNVCLYLTGVELILDCHVRVWNATAWGEDCANGSLLVTGTSLKDIRLVRTISGWVFIPSYITLSTRILNSHSSERWYLSVSPSSHYITRILIAYGYSEWRTAKSLTNDYPNIINSGTDIRPIFGKNIDMFSLADIHIKRLTGWTSIVVCIEDSRFHLVGWAVRHFWIAIE